MDGFSSQQPLNTSELLKVDPLQYLNAGFKEQVDLLDNKALEVHANLTRDSDNSLRILDREYKIDVQALTQRYRQTEPTEENMQRATSDLIKLRAQYAKKVEGVRGKIEPDLKDWEMNYNLTKQQLEVDRNEKVRQIQSIQQLYNKGVITDAASMQAEIYSIATGRNLSRADFRQPDPTQEAFRLGMLAVDLDEQGRHEEAKIARTQKNQLLGQIDPNVAKAVDDATRLTGLEGRQKARQAKREKERTGTIAEGITQAKNRTIKNLSKVGTSWMPMPSGKPTMKELRQRGTEEAYEEGKRLGYWN